MLRRQLRIYNGSAAALLLAAEEVPVNLDDLDGARDLHTLRLRVDADTTHQYQSLLLN